MCLHTGRSTILYFSLSCFGCSPLSVAFGVCVHEVHLPEFSMYRHETCTAQCLSYQNVSKSCPFESLTRALAIRRYMPHPEASRKKREQTLRSPPLTWQSRCSALQCPLTPLQGPLLRSTVMCSSTNRRSDESSSFRIIAELRES